MTLATISAPAHVFRRNWLVYRRLWHRSIAFGFLQPVLFLTAMGIGLGSLMSPSEEALDGISYLAFMGPGLLAATAMQTATFESTYPIANKIMWGRNYEAMLSTPLSVRHLVAGELAWIGFRLATIATAFLLALTLFGIVRSPWALVAVPATVLTGLGFAAGLIAFTATRVTGVDVGFAAVFRFVINPLFIFSGTFFPLSQLPDALQAVAWATPLFHGVELVRGLVLDRLDPVAGLVHVAYLLVFFGIGAVLADRFLLRRMAS